ncbi:hypothetical protein N7535_008186 [Penicillium sp. DV-2018c]|nr:hypothetical protein N7535_008186 [Penicillium sp. DV-2018c]
MPGHTQSTESREFCIERDHFLGLMHEIVHDLRYHYPENRNQIIGRVYQLYVVLHRYQRLGHSLAESHSPSDIGHDVAHDFFTPQAQGHENFFDTVFGYACRSTQAQLNYTLYDLEYDRDPARIAQMLEELMETWQLIEHSLYRPADHRALHRELVLQTLIRQKCPHGLGDQSILLGGVCGFSYLEQILVRTDGQDADAIVRILHIPVEVEEDTGGDPVRQL